MLWPFVQLAPGETYSNPIFLFDFSVAFVAQAWQIGTVALLPWTAFMVATEVLGLSSVLLHLAAGICGTVAIVITAYGSDPPHMAVQTAILAASVAFSLAYWIIAGRGAGSWRPRPGPVHRKPPERASEEKVSAP